MKTPALAHAANLAASAAFCFPAAAVAQQQTTTFLIGGQIKLGLDASQVSGASQPGGTAARAYRLANNTSFFFFDGKEQLSPDLKALFHLEWDFSADTGVQGAGRAFYVGFDHRQLGRLQLGRQSVYFSHHWFINDTHGAFDAAPNAANSLNVLGTINGAYFAGNFLNNTVRYEAPDIHGFSGIATYSFDAEQPGKGRNHTWYLGPTYTRGGLKMGYFHMVRDSQGTLPAQTVGALDQTADRFAIGYTWQGLRVGAVVDRNRVEDRNTGNSQYRYAFAIPINYESGPHLFSATYGQALATHSNGTTLADTGARMLSLSYQYKMSRRTTLDATLVELRNERNGRYNFWLGGINGSAQLSPANAGARVRMAYLGIKHQF
ncbi:porin [Cupriavidus necator]|nr:porin [Cupriavidus necator]